MFIYVIKNSVTNKIYIGQHMGKDLNKYLRKRLYEAGYGMGKHTSLYNSMRKHPKEAWSIEPLFYNVRDRKELDRLEILLIAIYDTTNPKIGYNICRGGQGIDPKTSKAYWSNPENREKVSLRMKGKEFPNRAKAMETKKEIKNKTGLWPGAPIGVDMTGSTVNGIKVVKKASRGKSKYVKWQCLCHCGNYFIAYGVSLRSGNTKSCGCLKKTSKLLYKSAIDMTNTTINGIKVIDRAPNKVRKNGKMLAMWNCICYCGAKFIVNGSYLRGGKTKSCGCLKVETSRKNGISLANKATSLMGKRFGFLTVIEKTYKNKNLAWVLECDCGNKTIRTSSHLNHNSTDTSSCGCIRYSMKKEIFNDNSNR